MGPFTGHILRKDEIDFEQDNSFMWEVGNLYISICLLASSIFTDLDKGVI